MDADEERWRRLSTRRLREMGRQADKGGTLEFEEIGGQRFARLAMVDGSRQLSALSPEEQEELRAYLASKEFKVAAPPPVVNTSSPIKRFDQTPQGLSEWMDAIEGKPKELIAYVDQPWRSVNFSFVGIDEPPAPSIELFDTDAIDESARWDELTVQVAVLFGEEPVRTSIRRIAARTSSLCGTLIGPYGQQRWGFPLA